MAAGRGGKLKTVAQSVAAILYLLPLPGWAEPVAWVVMGIAFVLTVVTGLDYVWQAWKLRRDARRAAAG
jgi:phosphatidylglycerophosphate synthase